MNRIVSPTPLVITIEHHEATGATGYHTNREFSLLGQLSLMAQCQRNLIKSTPGTSDRLFQILDHLAEIQEFLLQKPPVNPNANPSTNPTNGTT